MRLSFMFLEDLKPSIYSFVKLLILNMLIRSNSYLIKLKINYQTQNKFKEQS